MPPSTRRTALASIHPLLMHINGTQNLPSQREGACATPCAQDHNARSIL